MLAEVSNHPPSASSPASRSFLQILLRQPFKTVFPLVVSFVAAFVVVVMVGVSAHKLQLASKFSGFIPTADDPLPNAVPVMQPGVVIHVPHHDALNPSIGRDWVYLSWIKLKKVIAPDERVVLSAKYDPSSKLRTGYSLVLRGGVDGVRPIVYWQGEAGSGRWFTFAPMQLQSREWYLLAISFRKGTLGMHVSSAASPKGVLPLGGYEVGEDVLPVNNTELILGSFANGKFRGRLGPVGLITGNDVSKELPTFLKSVAKAPGAVPVAPEGAELVLWTDGKEDFGPHRLPVSITYPGGKEPPREGKDDRLGGRGLSPREKRALG